MKLVVFLSLLILLMGGLHTANADIKDKGLILYFDFDKEADGKIEDKTGGGNHANIVGKADISTAEKKYGKGSLEIRDANADVRVDSFNELESYQDNSYLFWLNFISAHNGAWSQIIAKKAPGSDRSPGIWICPGSLNIHWRFNPGNQGTHCVGPGGEGKLFELKKWYHIAGVKESGKFRFFIDGDQIEEHNVPSPHAQGNESLYIGKTSGYRAATFYIDDLYVYDRALDADEVQSVMDGDLLPVEPTDKLATSWGQIKSNRD